ncbi:hypothetical protein GLOTRDRAFT_117339 [Gloeophyllum trabeum ATCC 11539]|uniref:Zn(2)-C6 fungal-type domain-containing protein n=1 Tax=Gloeophyllum trabeum (strain ATCC 11539 / FP-39264 / Madison 617) TaxID=670483 RepID=S7RE49_GLOTA|nr:uncharacterized protein GLOTRDRAFT_117339 [Gloeophyllum trabeum ATCC 11539]EPQ52470.1 hypothetical protein GLOTRDRAFT_117339 [Gloeophyllum trabeum ATCC 11539]
MSSADEDGHENEQFAKKRRVQRACDVCRRKKIRCDGAQVSGNRCTNCATYNIECTYVEAAKKRGPPKGYVESLENRLEKLEKLLGKIAPEADLKELGVQPDRESWYRDRAQGESSQSMFKSQSSPVSATPPRSDDLDPSDDEYLHTTLTENLRKLTVDPNHHRFFGKSSGIMFIQTAIDLKNEYAGDEKPSIIDESYLGSKRPEFWSSNPWEENRFSEVIPDFDFPPPDLIDSLVSLYFLNINNFYPLLHQPTFLQKIAEGLHFRDSDFGSVLLAVCACGSRWSDDPRVLMEGTQSQHSAGWKWFNQVQMVRKSLLAPPCLYDLQLYTLSVIFLQGSSAPQGSWTMVGIGLRLAQDVGAHRRKVYNPNLTLEDELWKRAFWILVTLDRIFSSALGRPCAIQEEDFDLDMPAECDDEYWVDPDPNKAFKQPPDKPSKVAYFNSYLKLNQILACALRTIYSINKSKMLLGFVGQQWEQHIVAELDSALNKWIDSVPDHLRWDPDREDEVFFQQSAMLYCSYYHLQILVHRPFIPLPRKPSPLSFPSLAICTNAARSMSHVVDILRKRSKQPLPQLLMPVFSAGLVLLLNIWGGKRSGLSTDPAKEMAEVHKCMHVLKACEPRWHSAGRLWDILCDLASVGDLPLPQPSPAPGGKRERDSDEPIGHTESRSPSYSGDVEAPGLSDGQRTMAGTRRVSKEQSAVSPTVPPSASTSTYASPQSQIMSNSVFTLPIHSDELGRLPLHPNFGVPGQAAALPVQAPSSSSAGVWYGGDGSIPRQAGSSMAQMAAPGSMDTMSSMLGMSEIMFDSPMSGYSPFVQGEPPQPPYPGMQFTELGTGMAPQQQQQPQMFMNDDTINMWSNAPTGFEMDDWGTYISNVCGLSHHLPGGPGAPPRTDGG